MHIVFEEMIQSIRKGVDGAGDGLGDTVAQGEGERGLVAGWEGDVLQSAEIVFNLLGERRSVRWEWIYDIGRGSVNAYVFTRISIRPTELASFQESLEMRDKGRKSTMIFLPSIRSVEDRREKYSHRPIQATHRHRVPVLISALTGILPRCQMTERQEQQ
jgi:hypothetical protein